MSSLQVAAALKILTGRRDLIEPVLTVLDVWDTSLRTLQLGDLATKTNCPACVGGERLWLRGERGSQTTVLCGRNAVQVSPESRTRLSLEELASRLKGSGRVTHNPFLVRLHLESHDCELTIFGDGRAIEEIALGTRDLLRSRRSGRIAQVRALCRGARGLGRLLGLAGFTYEEYRHVHGR